MDLGKTFVWFALLLAVLVGAVSAQDAGAPNPYVEQQAGATCALISARDAAADRLRELPCDAEATIFNRELAVSELTRLAERAMYAKLRYAAMAHRVFDEGSCE